MTSGIVPGIVTDVGAVAGAIEEGEELAGKIIDQAKSASDRQAGADAEKSASLEKSTEIAQAQTAAVLAAPTTEAGTIDAMQKGKF